MSTKPRIVVPEIFYQVSSEGVNEIDIFGKDEFKTFFLNQLETLLTKYSFGCYAFALTKNQYHLILKSGQESISKIMQRLNSVFARKFNKKTGRSGVVFKTRFKSLIAEDNNLLEFIRFVHLQPIEKGECTLNQLDYHKWCSHCEIVDIDSTGFIKKNDILSCFSGPDPLKEYRNLISTTTVNNEVNQQIKNANLGKQGFSKPETWIIGKPEYIQHILELDRCRRVRLARYISEHVKLEVIHDEVASFFKLDRNSLFSRGLSNELSTARELFVTIGKGRFDFTGTQMAHYLRVTDSAVSRMISRFDNIILKDYLIDSVVGTIIDCKK